MRTPFVPRNFEAPQSAEVGGFILVPINAEINDEDWNVLQENADIIQRVRGGGSKDKDWPKTISLEENKKELSWLEMCAVFKQLFTYVIRNVSDNKYVGAVYIYPIEMCFPEKAADYDVDFSFWVRIYLHCCRH